MTATNIQTITLANARIALSVCVKATPDWYELANLIDDIENGYKSHLSAEHLHKVTLTSACRFWCEDGEPVTAQSFAEDMTAILDDTESTTVRKTYIAAMKEIKIEHIAKNGSVVGIGWVGVHYQSPLYGCQADKILS